MKNLILIISVTIMASFTFQSCSDDNVEGNDSYLMAEIDGVEIAVLNDLYAYATDFTSSLNVYGIMDINLQKSMYIQLPLGYTEGTYTFNDEVFGYVIDGEKAWSTLVGNGEGSITIEAVEGLRYTGTFSFTAYDFDNPDQSMKVTEGRFDVIKR